MKSLKLALSFVSILILPAFLSVVSFAESSRDGISAPDPLRVNQRNAVDTKSEYAKIERAIRRELKNDDSLSRRAQRIQIVPGKDAVTLRGRVSSEDEKLRVQQIAEKVASNRSIKNELATH